MFVDVGICEPPIPLENVSRIFKTSDAGAQTCPQMPQPMWLSDLKCPWDTDHASHFSLQGVAECGIQTLLICKPVPSSRKKGLDLIGHRKIFQD